VGEDNVPGGGEVVVEAAGIVKFTANNIQCGRK